MEDVLNWIWKQIVKVVFWLFDTLLIPFRWLLDGVLWVIGNALYFIFDGLLTVFQLFFQGLDFSAVLFSNTLGSSMHPLLVWFINQLGLPQCFSLIGLAIGIRMLLNLLPAAITRI